MKVKNGFGALLRALYRSLTEIWSFQARPNCPHCGGGRCGGACQFVEGDRKKGAALPSRNAADKTP